MGVQVTNNAVSTLAGSINAVVLSLSVQAGHGTRFPAASIISGNYFYITLIDAANNMEIVKVTDRTVDVFTIIRARDGTTARAFAANDRIELRPVAALFNELPNRQLVTADYADLSVTSAKLATSGVSAGTFGGPGNPVAVTVNSKGLITAIVDTAGVKQVDTFSYTGSAQTWTKPVGGTWALIEVWAGGGSGGKGRAASAAGGAGGGQYVRRQVLLSTLGATEQVTVGGGGASQTTADSNGTAGGDSTFGVSSTLVTAHGGGPGMGTDTTGLNNGGHGGGPGSTGVVGTQNNNATFAFNNYTKSAFEGEAGKAGAAGLPGTKGGSTTWNGAGGGGAADSATAVNGAGGDSVYGGAGGGAGAEDVAPGPGAGGTSQFGGNGGAGAFDASNATAGVVPGGGGGGSETGNSGAGGDGRVVVTVF
jgi:hypothetical protein